MIFQGCYFKDENIVQAWTKANKPNSEFHIDLADDKGLIFYSTSEKEREVFVTELDRRMSARSNP